MKKLNQKVKLMKVLNTTELCCSSFDSRPPVNLEPTLDFDKLKDPEEFFLAYERLESELHLLLSAKIHVATVVCIIMLAYTVLRLFFRC